MARSLADLRANPLTTPARPERSLTICLRPDLLAEVQALAEEADSLPDLPQDQPDDDGEPTGPPKRLVPPPEDPREAEIRARLAEVLAEMAEHEGELRLRANWSDGEWRQWCSANPARDRETRDGEYDTRVAAGYCNADKLVAQLGAFAHKWAGEPLAADDWATVLEPNIGQADKKQIAVAVVGMYESAVDFGEWRSGLYAILKRSTGSVSQPTISESATSGSTAGSRSRSTAATTRKAAKSR